MDFGEQQGSETLPPGEGPGPPATPAWSAGPCGAPRQGLTRSHLEAVGPAVSFLLLQVRKPRRRVPRGERLSLPRSAAAPPGQEGQRGSAPEEAPAQASGPHAAPSGRDAARPRTQLPRGVLIAGVIFA